MEQRLAWNTISKVSRPLCGAGNPLAALASTPLVLQTAPLYCIVAPSHCPPITLLPPGHLTTTIHCCSSLDQSTLEQTGAVFTSCCTNTLLQGISSFVLFLLHVRFCLFSTHLNIRIAPTLPNKWLLHLTFTGTKMSNLSPACRELHIALHSEIPQHWWHWAAVHYVQSRTK